MKMMEEMCTALQVACLLTIPVHSKYRQIVSRHELDGANIQAERAGRRRFLLVHVFIDATPPMLVGPQSSDRLHGTKTGELRQETSGLQDCHPIIYTVSKKQPKHADPNQFGSCQGGPQTTPTGLARLVVLGLEPSSNLLIGTSSIVLVVSMSILSDLISDVRFGAFQDSSNRLGASLKGWIEASVRSCGQQDL